MIYSLSETALSWQHLQQGHFVGEGQSIMGLVLCQCKHCWFYNKVENDYFIYLFSWIKYGSVFLNDINMTVFSHNCLITAKHLKADMLHQFWSLDKYTQETSKQEWFSVCVYVCVGCELLSVVVWSRCAKCLILIPTCLHNIYLLVVHRPSQSVRAAF